LNLSGTLANLGSPKFDSTAFNWESCFSNMTTSFIHLGSGGAKPKARDSWVY
jgi:hypothetical protein